MDNVQFVQLRDDFVKLYQLPLDYSETNKSVVSIKTFVYAIPLPSNPYSLRNDRTKLKDIYEWSVGVDIASDLMETKVERENNDEIKCEEEIKMDLVIHFEGIGDGYNTCNMFISDTMSVSQLLHKVKSLKKEYRYNNMDIYIYDKELDMIDPSPLSSQCVLYHSIKDYHQKALHILIKTQKNKTQNETKGSGRRSLRQKFVDLISSDDNMNMNKRKRAKSALIMGKKKTVYDVSMIYGAGTLIDDQVIAELNNMNKRRSKSSGIMTNRKKKTNIKIKTKRKKLKAFKRTKKKNKKRSKYVFNDD